MKCARKNIQLIYTVCVFKFIFKFIFFILYQIPVDLDEPIDIYCKWIDRCKEENDAAKLKMRQTQAIDEALEGEL